MKRGRSREFYLVILVIIFTFSAAIIIVNSPSITGGVAVQTISFLQEGERLHFEVRNVKNVDEVKMTILQDIKNAKIVVEDVDVPEQFDGYFLSAFKISSEMDDSFGRVDFLFKIKEADLVSLNDKELKLYRNNVELEMEFREKVNGYLFYTASSPALGMFVLGKQKEEEKVVPVAVTKPAPVIVPVPTAPEPISEPGLFRRIIWWWQRFTGR